MSLIPDGTFDALHNCSVTVQRTEGTRTAAGFQPVGTKMILDCRADAQESGKSLTRAQQLHEEADVVVYCSTAVTDVKPGDDATIDHDDGRTLTGTVLEAMPTDQSLLIAL